MINNSVVRGMGIPNYSNALGSISMIIYLYLKTHNKTGLKYLGKTTQNPYKYPGSGLYWSKHLNIHGNNVTTEILKECATNEEIKYWGEYYSEMWNVVNSDLFANLKIESGSGGPVGPSGAKKISEKIKRVRNDPNWRDTVFKDAIQKMLTTVSSDEWLATIGKEARKKQSDTINDSIWLATVGAAKAEKISKKARVRKNDPFWRNTVGVVARQKEIETKASQEWKNSVGASMKKAMSQQRNSSEYKNKHYKTCPHCNKTIDPGNYAQRHGDKCKMKENK